MWVVLTHRKNGLPAFCLPLHEINGAIGDIVVDCHHSLFGQRAGVFYHLLADLAEAWIDRCVVDLRGFAVHHAAWSELRKERRVLRIVRQFRLFLGVQVIEVAVELVEAVNGGEKFVAVAKMVLAELPGRIAERLEQLGNRRILLLQPNCGPRQADLGQTGAQA